MSGERGAVFAGPGDVVLLADLEQEIEFFGEEGVVVLQPKAEEREGIDERATAGDDFGTAVGDEVERSELLEDADGIGSGEDGDGAGEADVGGPGGCGGEDDGGRGVEVVGAVVLADTKDVEADLIGEDDLVDEVAETVGGGDGEAGGGVG